MAGPLSDLSRRLADFDQRRPVTAGIILILIITAAVFSGAYRTPIAPPPGCVTSLLVAHNLAEKNAFSIEVTAPDARPASGRPMPPAYPFLLAGLAGIDSGVARGLDCAGLSPSQHQLGRYFESLRFLQALAGVGILILVYHLAEALTGARSMAMATVVLYVIGGKLGEFARSIEPDNFRNLATFLSLLLLSIAYRKEQAWMFGAAGACLGVAALFHPILGILIFALPAVLAAIPWITGSGRCRGRRNALYNVAFVLGGLAVIAPWCARNLYLFGDPMLADRSEALLLSFRVAYNAMPYSDWPLAVLSWVPSYGNVLTQFFFGADAAHRFALLEPGAYFANGPVILAEGIDRTPTAGNPFFVVWSTYVAADPIRHLLTSIPVFARGMWGTHGFMGVVGLFLLPRMLRHLFAGPNPPAAIAVAAFAFLLVLIQSFLTPNFYWMNTPMLLLMSLAIADALPEVALWIDRSLGGLVSPSRLEPAGLQWLGGTGSR